MKHTLYIAKVGDEKRSAYAYIVTNYEGIQAAGHFITVGKHRHDGQMTDHIAFQRALRAASALAGVVDLTIVFDHSLIDLAFEMVEVERPKYPTIYQNSVRLTGRFQSHEFASTDFNETGACPEEVSVMDDAMEVLGNCRTFRGRLLLLKNCLFNNKIIIS
ncbi:MULTISPECIES: hypothetical protein [Bacillus amyloliquefaciens group]|uniref:hypothetical protein n=1 Tax=Bacillus amyloliquefaciens group TaxID=1938374 RepID=UPI001F0D3EB0|nr:MULTISPECIES: hypothetical protein [Bacillus amyloliquefaciens group]UMR27472.1 hypothetical protein MK616_06150 [Bacillus amyloliquefaciens]WHM03089.1 hypothetical protein QLX50_05920 [Bacillus velezensis]